MLCCHRVLVGRPRHAPLSGATLLQSTVAVGRIGNPSSDVRWVGRIANPSYCGGLRSRDRLRPAPKPEIVVSEVKSPAKPRAAGIDLHGDPLPPGAVARAGTSRLRHESRG